MQHVHVDLPLEISLICANTLHFLKYCFYMVLLLVEYVSYIVPSYVSIYTVSHSMTVAFDDAR